MYQQFRRKDPTTGEETEFMENVFDALCSALTEPENKKLFLDSEGVDLMVLMMKYVLVGSPLIILPDLGSQGEETCSVKGD